MYVFRFTFIYETVLFEDDTKYNHVLNAYQDRSSCDEHAKYV